MQLRRLVLSPPGPALLIDLNKKTQLQHSGHRRVREQATERESEGRITWREGSRKKSEWSMREDWRSYWVRMAPEGGNQDSRQAFIQASLSMGITPHWDVEDRRLKKETGNKGKVHCQYLLRLLIHLLSPILLYSTEVNWDADWRWGALNQLKSVSTHTQLRRWFSLQRSRRASY